MGAVANYEKLTSTAFKAVAVDKIMKKKGVTEKEATTILEGLMEKDIFSPETQVDSKTFSIRHYVLTEIDKM